MMLDMKDKLLTWAMAAALLLFSPTAALAQDEDAIDALRTGYSQTVAVDGGSAALTWLMLVGLGVVCFAVLFKDARRTHLD